MEKYRRKPRNKVRFLGKLNYNDVFNGDQPTIISLLEKISTPKIIELATRCIDSKVVKANISIQCEFITKYLQRNTSTDILVAIIRKINFNEGVNIDFTDGPGVPEKILNNFRTDERYTIFDINSILKIIEESLFLNNQLNHNEQYITEDDFLTFLKLTLLIGDDAISKKENETITNKDSLLLKYMFNTYEFQHSEKYFIIEVKKFLYLKNFLETTTDGKKLILDFNLKFGINSMIEYLHAILSIYQWSNDARLNGIEAPSLDFSKNKYFGKFESIWEQLCINEQQIIRDKHFLSLRAFPLYKISHQCYKVLFMPFMINKSFKALYFELRKIVEINEYNLDRFKYKFNDYLKEEFTEKYLLKNILDNIARNHKSTSFCDINKIQNINGQKSDFIIKLHSDVFIFECKDNLIDGTLIENSNLEEIRKLIYKRFIFDEDKKGGKDIGVLQILNFLKTIYEKDILNINTISKKRKVKFYPIIIVTDIVFNNIEVNSILNNYASERIKMISKELNIKIQSPTIIHINTLLRYERVLNDTLNLAKVLNEYQDSLKLLKVNFSFNEFVNEFCERNNIQVQIILDEKEILDNIAY